MGLESNANFSNSSVSSDAPFIHEKLEACFLLDVNFNSTHYLRVTHILTSIINIVLIFTDVAGNSMVIFSIWKTPSLHSPSNIFICCLAFSDLTVGLLAQPCFVIHKIGEILNRFEMYCLVYLDRFYRVGRALDFSHAPGHLQHYFNRGDFSKFALYVSGLHKDLTMR